MTEPSESSQDARWYANRALRRGMAVHTAPGVPWAVGDGHGGARWIRPETLPDLTAGDRPRLPESPQPLHGPSGTPDAGC